jgi:hypothetical protein
VAKSEEKEEIFVVELNLIDFNLLASSDESKAASRGKKASTRM